MKTCNIAFLLSAALIGACATPAAYVHWEKPGGTSADFGTDDESCSARATRMTPTPRANELAGGATPSNNRMDAPPRTWTSAIAESAYMDCMAERGWRVVQR
jgi:hypothetical protein